MIHLVNNKRIVKLGVAEPLNITICTPEITLTAPKLVDGFLMQSDGNLVYKMRTYPLPDLSLPLLFKGASAFTLDATHVQLISFTDLTKLTLTTQTITLTTLDEQTSTTTHLSIPTATLLLIDLNLTLSVPSNDLNEKSSTALTFTYRGLSVLNKYLMDVRSAKFEFERGGTLCVRLMGGREIDKQGTEFYFLASADEDI